MFRLLPSIPISLVQIEFNDSLIISSIVILSFMLLLPIFSKIMTQSTKLLTLSARTQRGFTLIELMVVVAIIAIISVVAVALFANAQQKARDGKRVAELETISNALEINKTSGGQYNAFATNQFAGAVIPSIDPGGTNNYCIANTSGATAPVAGNWPACTTGTAGYTTLANFAPTAATTSYKICTLREIDTQGGIAGTPLIFCRTNRQ